MNDTHRSAVAEVLAAHPVLGRLAPGIRERLERQARRDRHAGGSLACVPGQWGDRLYLVESGKLEIGDPDLDWSAPVGPGDWFGAGVTAAHHQGTCRVRALEDSVVLSLPGSGVAAACREQPAMSLFFPTLSPPAQSELVNAGAEGSAMNLLATPVRSLLSRAPVTNSPNASIAEVARQMRTDRVSSVLLVEQGLLFGLVTDRDLRNRVLAEGLDPSRPVADIATLAPLTVQGGHPAFEALALMARHNIHHVPVMDGERIEGMLTATNLTEQQTTSPIYLAGEIFRQNDIPGLARAAARVGLLQKHLAAGGASADSAGRIVTSITDAITARLIHLAQAQLGPAPVDYVWVAAGSQARSEQTARTDQDNCLVLDDAYDPQVHGDYFQALARFVCDGLAACGYVHCPGDIMAMTDQWRQPRQRWAQYFRQWINQPEPMALMLTCVFFDLRAIHGNTALLDSLRAEVLQHTRRKSLFLSHMVGNALKHRPPLGLFGQITPARTGEHAGRVDLKHSGIVPIVDLARIYALAGGVAAVNTRERLEQAGGSGEITAQAARDLRDALELLGRVRLAHQARQIAAHQQPDNFLALEELSGFERSHLKKAFAVVQRLQSVLSQRYGGYGGH